jgi:selenide,water dikinase
MLEVGVHACTDVTGFGLLGHLRAMVVASRAGARIFPQDLPVLEGVWDLLAGDMAPGGTYRNLSALGESVVWPHDITEIQKLLLCDPQTSGGLLIAVPPERAHHLITALVQAGTPAAAEIGEIVEGDGRIEVVL